MHNSKHMAVDNFELRNIQTNLRSTTRTFSAYLTAMLRFTSSFRAAVAVRSGRTLKLLGALFALAATVTIQIAPAQAATSLDHYKLYLHSKIVSEKQYKCAYYVAHIESRWNYKATNRGHYGLFQMKNAKVKYMNGYQQIDLWAKYVGHRYKGNYCLAMHHLKTRNWQ